MSKRKDYIRALEHRRHYLDRKLKTSGLLYPGRSYDGVEYAALGEAIKLMEETWHSKQSRKQN